MFRPPPFPAEAVRDLLGAARALYAATPATERVRRRKLAEVGLELAGALLDAQAGGKGVRRARLRAEAAAEQLGLVVGMLESAEPMVTAACSRVRRSRA